MMANRMGDLILLSVLYIVLDLREKVGIAWLIAQAIGALIGAGLIIGLVVYLAKGSKLSFKSETQAQRKSKHVALA